MLQIMFKVNTRRRYWFKPWFKKQPVSNTSERTNLFKHGFKQPAWSSHGLKTRFFQDKCRFCKPTKSSKGFYRSSIENVPLPLNVMKLYWSICKFIRRICYCQKNSSTSICLMFAVYLHFSFFFSFFTCLIYYNQYCNSFVALEKHIE